MNKTPAVAPAFYIAAYEAGADNPSLPTWANRDSNPTQLAENYATEHIVRREIPEVPGAFQLLNVFSHEECQRLIAMSETLGYLEDAAVSLPREIRHNDNVVWVTDEKTDAIIWQRVANSIAQNSSLHDNKMPLGLNARFRFYRYNVNDFFSFHSDGAWPGSRVIDGQLIANAYPDRFSQLTFLILLNDNFDGGATRFLVNADDPLQPVRHYSRTKEVDVRTPVGGVLCFPHGLHPLNRPHSGETITRGVKYIIRTDVLFEL